VSAAVGCKRLLAICLWCSDAHYLIAAPSKFVRHVVDRDVEACPPKIVRTMVNER